MFRNFNKLIPCRSIIEKNIKEVKDIVNNIPLSERWECRDFNIKDFNIKDIKYPVSSNEAYTLIVPDESQYDKKKKH